MIKSLPSRPNLEQLKNQAKDLLKSLKSGHPDAMRRIRENHPLGSAASEPGMNAAELSLVDAQLVIAREYGFASWLKLKEHIDAVVLDAGDPMELFKQAFANHDADLFRRLLDRHPNLKARINEPVAAFDAPVITRVRTREMLEVLLDAGADLNARSQWWAGGFGLLDGASPELAAYAIERGAMVGVHAAARLGLTGKLHELIEADPGLVNARGGDGQTPLHFASTIEVARYLLDRGADIDARDVDHESTPAQYMVRERQEVLRFLIQRGCRTDVLMASALGDAERVRKHLDADPECVRVRVNCEHFPMINPRAGGTIYQWTLGWHVSAHEVARQFGHEDILRLLMDRSPADVKLIAAGWLDDESEVRSLLAENRDLAAGLSEADRRQVAHAARNNNSAAVRRMLAAGLPVSALGQHGATPLHWAAFHGNVEMTREILRYNPPLEVHDADFNLPPLGWGIYGSEHGWHCLTGNYAAAVEALIQAGAKLPEKTGGTDAVREVLERYGVKT